MDYKEFKPKKEFDSLIKCYWTLEVPNQKNFIKQRIIPDGCIELAFILGDDIKRYTSDLEFIIQPRSMVIGQITEPFYIEPTGYVNTFSVRFYPYGFANFIDIPIENLTNKETPLEKIFNQKDSSELEYKINKAKTINERINIIELFLSKKLIKDEFLTKVVKKTIEDIIDLNGNFSVDTIIKNKEINRKQLERKFQKYIGTSPKKLGKIVRLQSALNIILNNSNTKNLTEIAYDSGYFDQAHFIKDFLEFTGSTPKKILENANLTLSSLFYSKS